MQDKSNDDKSPGKVRLKPETKISDADANAADEAKFNLRNDKELNRAQPLNEKIPPIQRSKGN